MPAREGAYFGSENNNPGSAQDVDCILPGNWHSAKKSSKMPMYEETCPT